MRVMLVPSSTDAPAGASRQYLTSFIINGNVAIDAGSLGLYGSPRRQARVRHVFLTHTHLDHLASLPLFLLNVYSGSAGGVTVYAPGRVLDCLRRDLFNGRLWPDFFTPPAQGPAFLKAREVVPGRVVRAGGFSVLPVEVNHAVPTVGYLVGDGKVSVAFPSDTGPTEEIWDRFRKLPNPRAVFLEATLPNSLADLAQSSGHLTPAHFAREARKLPEGVRLLAVHLHPRNRGRVVRELRALGLPGLEVARPGKVYRF